RAAAGAGGANRAATLLRPARDLARIDPHHIPPAQLDRAGRCAARLAHICRATHVHLDLAARVARLRVPGGQRRGTVDHIARDVAAIITWPDHDVTAGVAGRVEPEVARPRDAERQLVVLTSAPTDQHFPAIDVDLLPALSCQDPTSRL